jgi:hypothetical protein
MGILFESWINSLVPRDSNPRIIDLATSSSNGKLQIRPLVREEAQHQSIRKCLTVT